MRSQYALGWSAITLPLLLLWAGAAQAYVGPGMGLGALGALVGVVLTVLLAIVGLVWYPLKRVFRKRRQEGEAAQSGEKKEGERTG